MNERPSLLSAALIMLHDGCPPEAGCQLCAIEDADDGTGCTRCWCNYLFWVANGRRKA